MEPRIQYAKTSDGVNIAYWTLGEGHPFVHLPVQFSHVQLEWQFEECRGWYERLSEKRKLIRFDHRGFGLSDRDVGQVSVDTVVSDLEGVVDRLGLERFTLFGPLYLGSAAITYATRHPERLSHLILWCASARMADWYRSPQLQALVSLRDEDWVFLSEAMARVVLGWSAGEPASRYASLARESVTRETLLTALTLARQVDVTALLEEVQSPTLVLHRRQFGALDLDAARSLAAEIPDARLAILEGESGAPYLGDTEAVLAAFDEFLPESEETKVGEHPSGTAIMLFADIAESTALTERLGDSTFREKARALDGSLRTIIRESGGTPIEGKLLGDGVLATFASARQAIEVALGCGAAGDESGLPLHLGVHAGDVIREEGNVYGGAVNIAARIAGASAPGEVLVSQTVRDLARTSADVSFEDRGQRKLRGVEGRQRLFAVRERGDA